jgi:N-terminal domain of anti-restriction factor ArdC
MTATTDARTEKMQAVLTRLEEGVASILTSTAYRDYLAAMGRFHSYSFNNTLLILLARPDATRVAGFNTWRTLDRCVMKGEKGIPIIVPHRGKVGETDDGEDVYALRGFGVGYVFDLAQTEGASLPDVATMRGSPLGSIDGDHDATARIVATLTGIAGAAGVAIVSHDLAVRGYWDPARRQIGIRGDLAGIGYAKTLAHEVAHMLADHRGATSRDDAEDVAESAAYVTLSHYGIDTSGYSFGYVAGWAKDMGVVRRNLGEVQRIAHQMIVAIDG